MIGGQAITQASCPSCGQFTIYPSTLTNQPCTQCVSKLHEQLQKEKVRREASKYT